MATITNELSTALTLINKLINKAIEQWGSTPAGRDYLIRHTEFSNGQQIVIQPTYSDVWYRMLDYVKIAEACGCSWYVTCEKNLIGVISPTMYIF